MFGFASHDENGPSDNSQQLFDWLTQEECPQAPDGGRAPDDQVGALRFGEDILEGERKPACCAHANAITLPELQGMVRQPAGSIGRRRLSRVGKVDELE